MQKKKSAKCDRVFLVFVRPPPHTHTGGRGKGDGGGDGWGRGEGGGGVLSPAAAHYFSTSLSSPSELLKPPLRPSGKTQRDRLVGLVVKASTSRAEDPGFDSRLRRGDSCGSSHTTSDTQTGTPVADRLVGLVVKASASRAGGPGFESR